MTCETDHVDKYEGLEKYSKNIDESIENSQYVKCGRVVHVSGLVVEVTGLSLSIGNTCRIILNSNDSIFGEVVGFTNEKIIIMPFSSTVGIASGMIVVQVPSSGSAPVSNDLLGRVVDALGNVLDDSSSIDFAKFYPLHPQILNPLKRARIKVPLDVGVRAINSLITICQGQRMGIFAESGMGKSVLLGMMTKFTSADVVVVGLIGERGREVKEFIEEILGEEGLKKSVIIAVPADNSPLMKVTGANYATSIAEYFRDQGNHVLLIIDSLTRYAQAYREISLASGELPATKGYTPSVFAKLSTLIERSGCGLSDESSITSIYTILLENETLSDPIAEHIRSLIDGHIVLSRELADSGHYPAIDIEKSISRVMNAIVPKEQVQFALIMKKIINTYHASKDLVSIGMYQAGSDKDIDLAIKYYPDIVNFLTQQMDSNSNMESSINDLNGVIDKMLNNL
tara:strand:+ start:125 stop:1492 length:1368 start_codon:yes stop_codon:yes gene_type:complete